MYYKRIETDKKVLASYVLGLKEAAATRMARVAEKLRKKRTEKKEASE